MQGLLDLATPQEYSGREWGYAQALRTFTSVIIQMVAAAVVLTTAVAIFLPGSWERTAMIQVGSDENSLGTPDVYIEIAKSRPVVLQASKEAGVDVGRFQESIGVEPVRSSNLLELSVVGTSQQTARSAKAWQRAIEDHLKAAHLARLDEELALQEASVAGVREFLHQQANWKTPIGLRGPVFLSSSMEAFAALRRLQAQRDLIVRGHFPDWRTVAPFRAERQSLSQRLTGNAVMAAFLALLVGAILPIVFPRGLPR